MTIPSYMKVNKTNDTPSKELIDAILAKSIPLLAETPSFGRDYCYVGDLFITIEWRGFPLSKSFKKWYCITVDKKGHLIGEDYLLVQYHDFTRIYHPGTWEDAFMEARNDAARD